MARPLLPLSNRASTASCNIRFSLRTIISGARSSIRRLSRLFLLITRRYKSFKSEVANLPPSKGTKGRSSGGITGITSKIIHSGREPDSRKASRSFNRLTSFLRLASEFVSASSCLTLSASSSKLMEASTSLMASAPIPTRKVSSPYSSTARIYCSSVRSSCILRLVRPGSTTKYFSKYKTASKSFKTISTKSPIREGSDFKNQI